MTEDECLLYAQDLIAVEPWAAEFEYDCKGCVRWGNQVAFNTHDNPSCSNTWETVCKESRN
eukprot:UN25317